ncbi:MAG: Wzz/FepE/Etk N-terminal domain-containing protein [bacterium]|nr:Wzz/FepE/Etk N-terminal domain-containing protein [bacterium]
MELFEFINILKKRKQTVSVIVLLTLLLAMVFTLVQPFKYGANLKVLVIQNFSANTDPYTASKSNEYLSNVLARVIYSNSFYNNILVSGFSVNKIYFSGNVEKQMKKWTKTINAKVINDSGIINVNVYHTNRAQAEQIAKAISYALQTKHTLYHGGGDNVKIKIIDEPFVSNFPVKPNVILNLSLGLIIGLFLAFCYVYLFPEDRFDIIRLFEKKKKVKKHRGESLSVKNDLQELKIKNNWQTVGEVIDHSFVAPITVFIEKKVDNSEVLFKDKAINNNLVKQSAKEDFIGDGDIKNVFGKLHSNDL